ncbi:MAG: rod shape-determining protein MreD [Anaerolineae bacterium]
MNKQTPLWLPFLLALFATLFGHIFFQMHLMTFVPFLALTIIRKSLLFSLWIAFLSGLVLDLLGSELRLGFFALNYSLTTLLTYRQKKHFFEDKAFSLVLFSLILSCTSTAIQAILFNIFGAKVLDAKVLFSWKFILTELVLMSFLDALYALLWFTLPMRCYVYFKRVGWKAFTRGSDA